jgi:hypothetical protein
LFRLPAFTMDTSSQQLMEELLPEPFHVHPCKLLSMGATIISPLQTLQANQVR